MWSYLKLIKFNWTWQYLIKHTLSYLQSRAINDSYLHIKINKEIVISKNNTFLYRKRGNIFNKNFKPSYGIIIKIYSVSSFLLLYWAAFRLYMEETIFTNWAVKYGYLTKNLEKSRQVVNSSKTTDSHNNIQ